MKKLVCLVAAFSLVHLPAMAGTALVVEGTACGVALSPTKINILYSVIPEEGPNLVNRSSSRGIDGMTVFSTTSSEGRKHNFGLHKGRRYCVQGKYFLSPTENFGHIESGTLYPQW